MQRKWHLGRLRRSFYLTPAAGFQALKGTDIDSATGLSMHCSKKLVHKRAYPSLLHPSNERCLRAVGTAVAAQLMPRVVQCCFL